MVRKLPPIHPGEVLREEFLLPMALTPYAVARACGVPRTRIERLAREETPVTADTALRLGRFFGTTPSFWMNLQARYDLEVAEDETAAEIKRIKPDEAEGGMKWLAGSGEAAVRRGHCLLPPHDGLRLGNPLCGLGSAVHLLDQRQIVIKLALHGVPNLGIPR